MRPRSCPASAPAILAGDYNVIPTERDVYKPERWVDDALFRIEVRDAFARLIRQGWIDGIRTSIRMRRFILSGTTFAMRLGAMRGCVSIIFC